MSRDTLLYWFLVIGISGFIAFAYISCENQQFFYSVWELLKFLIKEVVA